MTKKLTTSQIAEKSVEKYGIVEKIEVPEYDKEKLIPTGKIDHIEYTVHIPETLMGFNLAGYGKTQKEAKADLTTRLKKVIDSDELDLANDWADRHL